MAGAVVVADGRNRDLMNAAEDVRLFVSKTHGEHR